MTFNTATWGDPTSWQHKIVVASQSTQLEAAANILLAVYNPLVGAMLEATLMSRSNTFIAAPTQEAALQMLRANGKSMDLVITSPRYKELSRLVIEEHTDARMLYVCASNPELTLPRQSMVSVLAMPFSPTRFIQEVNRLLVAKQQQFLAG